MKTIRNNKICLWLMSLLLVLATSCKDDDESGARLSFSRSLYILPAIGDLEVELRATVAPESDMEVPVTVEGSAIEDEDFTMSDKKFVLKAGETTAKLTITPKNNLTSGREIRLSIVPTGGYSLGNKNVAMIPVETKERIMYSFNSPSTRLLSEAEVWVELRGETTGKDYAAPSDIKLPIALDASSTAVLGTDVELEDGMTYVTIKQGSRQAKFTVKVTDGAEDYAGKKAILKLSAPEESSELYYAGSFETYTLNLDQLKFTDMLGKWKPVAITNMDLFVTMGIEDAEYVGLLPENNDASDYLEFVHENGTDKIIPHLKGDLTSYFCNPAGHTIVFDHIEKGYYDFATWEEYDIPYFTISQVNKLFSKKKQELGDVFIGIDKVDDNNINVYFHEYVPTDFFVQSYEAYGWDATFFGITYSFTRVTE